MHFCIWVRHWTDGFKVSEHTKNPATYIKIKYLKRAFRVNLLKLYFQKLWITSFSAVFCFLNPPVTFEKAQCSKYFSVVLACLTFCGNSMLRFVSALCKCVTLRKTLAPFMLRCLIPAHPHGVFSAEKCCTVQSG